MTNDLFILIKQDRENLANLTRGITQADPDNRARRANDATNLVAMMVHGKNAVIYPPLQESSHEGAAMVEDSLKRLRSIIDDFDRLERMTFNDLFYPSFFDRTFDRFFQHWDVEDPVHQVSAAGQAQQGGQQGTQLPMTFSQHVHQILDTAHDVLTRTKQQQGQKKDQGGSAAGSVAKGPQKDCGCIESCTCPSEIKRAAASAHPEHQPAAV